MGAAHSRKVAGQAGLVHPLAVPIPNRSMPLELANNNPSLLIRRQAFERAGITRAAIDERLRLTDQEFRVEGDLIIIGPILDEDAMQELIQDFEGTGLVYFEDFFDLSGNWPEWLVLFARVGPNAP
jgi:hypothetical protein